MKPASTPPRFIRIAITALRGFAMGAADLVPGVSGGTVALLLGIYERFIGAIRGVAAIGGRLLRGDIAGARSKFKEADWVFVLPLGVGIVIAVFSLASLMERLLHDYPEEMAGIFMGLVLASLVATYLSLERHTNHANSDPANLSGQTNLSISATSSEAAFTPSQQAPQSGTSSPSETASHPNPKIAAKERTNNPLTRPHPLGTAASRSCGSRSVRSARLQRNSASRPVTPRLPRRRCAGDMRYGAARHFGLVSAADSRHVRGPVSSP